MRRLVLLSFLLAAPAIAQEQGPGGRDGGRGGPTGTYWLRPEASVLLGFDADHDGKVTAAEVEAGADIAFRAADADGSAGVRALEYADWAERVLGARDATPSFVANDANGDLELAPAEFRKAWFDIFKRYDPEKTGAVAMKDVVQGASNAMGGGEGREFRRERHRQR